VSRGSSNTTKNSNPSTEVAAPQSPSNDAPATPANETKPAPPPDIADIAAEQDRFRAAVADLKTHAAAGDEGAAQALRLYRALAEQTLALIPPESTERAVPTIVPIGEVRELARRELPDGRIVRVLSDDVRSWKEID